MLYFTQMWADMLTPQNVVLAYLLLTLIVELVRSLKYGIIGWLPKEYRNELVGIKKNDEVSRLCDNLQDTDNRPTLLIIATMISSNKFICSIDFVSKILTFGCLRFNEILPVGAPVKLMVFFKNLSGNDISGVSEHKFNIYYPGAPESIMLYEDNNEKVFSRNKMPQRNWKLDIPKIAPGKCCVRKSERFFIPEMPGTHELEIAGLTNHVLAGPHGVCNRRYRIPEIGAPWRHSFHISSGYEYKVFFVAFAALLASVLNVIAAVWRR